MLNFRYIIRVSQLCKFPSLGRRQGRQAWQGLQVAEVGVIFLSRLISALPACAWSVSARPSERPRPRLAMAWSLRPQLSAVSVSSLASAQSQSDCCADSEVITVRLHRAGLPANTDTRPWLTPRPPTSPNSSSSRPAEPRRR